MPKSSHRLQPVVSLTLVIDETTDFPFLEQQLKKAWLGMKPGSPNRTGGGATLRLFRLDSAQTEETEYLLKWLCYSAAS